MHDRTRACNISQRTKIIVFQRDHGQCIFCNQKGLPEAHVISRAHGGLGVPQNIVTICRHCHDWMDNTTVRDQMVSFAKQYLQRKYPNWAPSQVTYDKYDKDKAKRLIIEAEIALQKGFKPPTFSKGDKDKAPPDGFTWI